MKDRITLYEDSQELLLCELEKLNKNESLTPQLLEFMDKVVDIIKDLDDIMYKEEQLVDGYSQRGGRYYTDGNSYRSGRMYDGGSRMRSDGYSRRDSKSSMLDHLYAAHDNAMSEDERKRIKKMIDEIENS